MPSQREISDPSCLANERYYVLAEIKSANKDCNLYKVQIQGYTGDNLFRHVRSWIALEGLFFVGEIPPLVLNAMTCQMNSLGLSAYLSVIFSLTLVFIFFIAYSVL